MHIREFRIQNFRSISDTGWRRFSNDNVTIFVGQNESGKTSILDALSKTLSGSSIAPNDVRINEGLPKVQLKLEITEKEFDDVIRAELVGYSIAQIDAARARIFANAGLVSMQFAWEHVKGNEFLRDIRVIDDDLDKFLASMHLEVGSDDPPSQPSAPDKTNAQATSPSPRTDVADPSEANLTTRELAAAVFFCAPRVIMFRQESGLLPDSIDIDDDGNLSKGDGAIGAKNYLEAAKLDLKRLISSDLRAKNHLLKKANELISRDFGKFWSQTIGKTTKLYLECALETYGADAGPKMGKRHLVFWISDGLNKLYPQQRSQGVRWFVSFYLQLRATEAARGKRVFLLDEPGANLHSKAQGDVLRLINQLSKDIMIVYSTHSPHMIEYDKIYRVHGVQREGDQDDSPTIVIDAHRLGSASIDTLSPILTLMGVDLSSQTVVKKQDNVLLEEISALYYLTAFWELTAEKTTVHFLAASGASNVETLAYLFTGWGLKFVVAVDDDGQGRAAYNSLKKNLFGDDEESAAKNLAKLKGFSGIEDVFSKSDFAKFVLEESNGDRAASNSQMMRATAKAKAVFAYKFLQAVRHKNVTWEQLDKESQENINGVKTTIIALLRP